MNTSEFDASDLKQSKATSTKTERRKAWTIGGIVAVIVGLLVAAILAFLNYFGVAFQGSDGWCPKNSQQLPFRAKPIALGFDAALGMEQRPRDAPGMLDSHAYVYEKTGKITRIDLESSDENDRKTVLDLSPIIVGELGVKARHDERGLLGLAFDPREDQPYAYITFTAPPPADNKKKLNNILKVRRYTIENSGSDAERWTQPLDILSIDERESFHHAGTLAFGPSDGYLYISSGDGGPQMDPRGHALNTHSLQGKLLRIDVRNASQSEPYRVPPDNPFAFDSEEGAPEIIAIGLRNPWKFSIDPRTDAIVIGDVGFNARESVKYAPSAVAPRTTDGQRRVWNFGWNAYEGTRKSGYSSTDAAVFERHPFTEPVYDYTTSTKFGRAIVGGFITLDPRDVTRPVYVFADYVTGRLVALEMPRDVEQRATQRWRCKYTSTADEWFPSTKKPKINVPAMARDRRGRLYVLPSLHGAPLIDSGGASGVYRLEPDYQK